MSFHSLSHSCYALRVSRVHVRVQRDPMLLGSWLICIRYERWVTFLLGSSDHCPILHSIIGDMTFLYCTNMGWSSFIPLSYWHFFCVPSHFSRSSFHLLSISYILIHISYLIPSSHHSHVSLMVWPLILSTYSFFCSSIDISFGCL